MQRPRRSAASRSASVPVVHNHNHYYTGEEEQYQPVQQVDQRPYYPQYQYPTYDNSYFSALMQYLYSGYNQWTYPTYPTQQQVPQYPQMPVPTPVPPAVPVQPVVPTPVPTMLQVPATTTWKGTKKALLIGITYKGTSNQLNGTYPDTVSMYKFLTSMGYSCVVLADFDPRYVAPNKVNILNWITKLVNESKPGDKLVLHYSGHGTGVGDTSGDEPDRQDEAICPIESNGQITTIVDDTLKPLLLGVQRDVSMLCLFDSCNSGTVSDLSDRDGTRGGLVTVLSAAMDTEYAADLGTNGAFTATLLKVLQANKAVRTVDLLTSMTKDLAKYNQRPQLTATPVIPQTLELFW